jgi:hypothetical protein
MARTTDRQHVSEAIRTQPTKLWRVIWRHEGAVVLKTDFDETLSIGYGVTDRIKYATYIHRDENGRVVTSESITHKKRDRVLSLISKGY